MNSQAHCTFFKDNKSPSTTNILTHYTDKVIIKTSSFLFFDSWLSTRGVSQLSETGNSNLRLFGIGLQLACDRGSCGWISLQRHKPFLKTSQLLQLQASSFSPLLRIWIWSIAVNQTNSHGVFLDLSWRTWYSLVDLIKFLGHTQRWKPPCMIRRHSCRAQAILRRPRLEVRLLI